MEGWLCLGTCCTWSQQVQGSGASRASQGPRGPCGPTGAASRSSGPVSQEDGQARVLFVPRDLIGAQREAESPAFSSVPQLRSSLGQAAVPVVGRQPLNNGVGGFSGIADPGGHPVPRLSTAREVPLRRALGVPPPGSPAVSRVREEDMEAPSWGLINWAHIRAGRFAGSDPQLSDPEARRFPGSAHPSALTLSLL